MKLAIAFSYLAMILSASMAQADALPSWNEGATKQHILAFIAKVEAQKVPVEERIATFDNDGTLLAEKPIYMQMYFSMDRVKQLSPQHPEWQNQEPFKTVLTGDIEAMTKLKGADIAQIYAAIGDSLTIEQFQTTARDWLKTAVNPVLKRPFVQCAYLPMIELMNLLRAHKFKVFMVTGGGTDLVRTFAQDAYGIPSQQIVGLTVKTDFKIIDGVAQIVNSTDVLTTTDGPRKATGIALHIGRRPLLAFGNSDGDQQMLEYTDDSRSARPHLMLLLHHDDAAREFAYDRESSVGHLESAWDEALARHWDVVSMKNDFRQIFK